MIGEYHINRILDAINSFAESVKDGIEFIKEKEENINQDLHAICRVLASIDKKLEANHVTQETDIKTTVSSCIEERCEERDKVLKK